MSEEARLRMIEEQTRLELDSVERGAVRYRREVEKADLADTDPGIRMMDTILKGLIPAIQQAQVEALAYLEQPRRTPQWVYPILMLDAERLAVITARSVLTFQRKGEVSRSVTNVAIMVAKRVKEQREFDLWKEAQAAAEKAAKAEGRPYVNVFKLMVQSVKKLDQRAVRKWIKKGEQFDREEWPTEIMVHFGWKLLDLLAQHGGGCFEIVLEPIKGKRGRKTERIVRLTPLALDYINKQHAANELTRPWLLPMVSPPKEWRVVA